MQRYTLRQGKLREDENGQWVRVDEVERLRAIVNRLPKTADGVPVVPHDHPILYVFCQRVGLHRLGENDGPWRLRVDTYEEGLLVGFVQGSHVEGFKPNACYSTREAAEAAKPAAGGSGD